MSAPKTTPAHLLIPDALGEQVFATDEHRRTLACCNFGHPISFSDLHRRLARDVYTFGIGPGDEMKLGQILGDLVKDGDCIQHADGTFEATDQGWHKITNTHLEDGDK